MLIANGSTRYLSCIVHGLSEQSSFNYGFNEVAGTI